MTNDNNSKKNFLFLYFKYSTLILQIIVVIIFFTYLGNKIDEFFSFKFSFFTIFFSLLSLAIGFYLLFKKLKK